MKKSEYNAHGCVIGNYWGGGKGLYVSRTFKEYSDKDKLINDINKALKNGSLDGGMGYESLEGALMEIQTTEFVTVDNKEYSRTEYENVEFGKITEDIYDKMVEYNLYSLQR